MNYTTAAFLTIFLLAQNVRSQEVNLDFQVYGFEDGLTHRNVFKVLQDERGLIWVATINGLNRFDGERFLQFSTTQPRRKIPANYISNLAIDRHGHLLMTGPNFLSELDMHTFDNKVAALDSASVLNGKQWLMGGVCEDEKGNVWCTNYAGRTGDCVVQRMDTSGMVEDMFSLRCKFPRIPIIAWHESILVGAAHGEIWELNLQKRRIKTLKIPKATEQITDFQQDSDGNLWILLQNGAVFLKRKEGVVFEKIFQIPGTANACNSLLVADKNTIWIGGLEALWRIKLATQTAENFHPRLRDLTKNTCTVRHILRDRAGVIWVATDFGLVKIAANRNLFEKYLHDGNDHCANGYCSMRGMAEDEKGNIYFSYYSAIHVLDKATGQVRPLFPKKDFFLAPFGLAYAKNALWTGSGLRIQLPSAKVDSILKAPIGTEGVVLAAKDGSIWWGGQGLLTQYFPDKKQFAPFSDPKGIFKSTNEQVTFLTESQSGEVLWVATLANGVFQIDKKSGTIAHFSADGKTFPTLSHSRILAVALDKNENPWLATAQGISHVDTKTQRVKIYTTKQGLPNDFINGLLLEGDSALWASTDKGVARLSFKSGKFRQFFKQDGLSENEFNRMAFFTASDGRLFFGGLNGVSAFYPGGEFVVQREAESVPLLLTDFAKYDGRLDSLVEYADLREVEKGVILNAADRYFEFSFCLADYGNPASNLYSYQLEGFDEGWSEPGISNTVRYNNIPAGYYTFRVKAAPFGRAWMRQEIAIPVVVEQVFYKSWKFFVLLGVALVGLFFAISRYREYNLRQREQILETEVRERTKELAQEKQKSEELLLNILPADTAEELKKFGKTKARRHEVVTVLFSDFKNFSRIAEELEPEEVVAEIDYCFRKFDEIIEHHGLEKIKTIGDAYMCAGGVPKDSDPSETAVRVVRAGLDIQDFMKKFGEEQRGKGETFFEARVGVHSGPVVAGIVGFKKFAYDIWGDTVNIASRMETMSEAGRVNISEDTLDLVRGHFSVVPNGIFETKTGAEVRMYLVEEG